MIAGTTWQVVATIVFMAVIVGYLAQITTEMANITRELRGLRNENSDRMAALREAASARHDLD